MKRVFGWLSRQEGGAETHRFRCNICRARNRAPKSAFGRELRSCKRCGSTVRMRSIVHVLSMELFGVSLALSELPKRSDLHGLGMSDRDEYASRLAKRLNYQNTFYDVEPRLDILDPAPGLLGTLDFLISTDVFEHIAPPVQAAFDRACELLKPGGVFVFSVPHTRDEKTVEHFPELHDYRIEDRGSGPVLLNLTADGREQVFEDLVFHGGPGETLEMRVFALGDLLRNFAAAGFEPPKIYGEDVSSCGMIWEDNLSLTMGVRKPTR